MKEILLGTNNPHKIREISKLLVGIPVKIKTLRNFPHIPPVKENGTTLKENAVKKAWGYSVATGLFTIADDTGLEVSALKGEPGVKSARYAGGRCSYSDNNKKLLKKLSGVKYKRRTARFRCVVACADTKRKFLRTVAGSISGIILETTRGQNGFGYDPLFYVPQTKKTLAEMSLKEKNKISHRFKAILKSREVLKKYAKNSYFK